MDIIKSASFFLISKIVIIFFACTHWVYMDGNGLNDIMLGLAFSCQYHGTWIDIQEIVNILQEFQLSKCTLKKYNFSLIGFEYYLSDKETVHVRWLRTSILRYSLFNFMVSISTKTEPTTAWQLMSWYVCWYQS